MIEHQFRENGTHYNGGAVFFGYGYTAVGEPRLCMVRKWYRQGERRGKTEDSFSVDGLPVESYDAAIEALKSAPVFSDAEIEALRIIGDEPADHRKTIDFQIRHSLAAKGAIVWGPPGRCARTAAGRDVICRAVGAPISALSGRPGYEGYAEFVRIAESWGFD